MSTNVISIEVTQEQTNEVERILDDLSAKLAMLKELTLDDRKRLAKMGRKHVDFVDRSYRHAEINPGYLTGAIPFVEFKKDYQLSTWLRLVEKKLGLISNKVKDSAMQAEAEAYQTARLYYTSVKAAAKAGDEIAGPIDRDLSPHFQKQTKAKVENPPKDAPKS